MDEKISMIRRMLKIPDEVLAVNGGSWGPVNTAALEAMKASFEMAQETRYFPDTTMALMAQTRDADRSEVALLLGCEARDIALVESTTYGINACLWGMDWEPDDEIIAGTMENPAIQAPLETLAKRRGVKIVWVRQAPLDQDMEDALLAAVTAKTKALVISHVLYCDGRILNISLLSEQMRPKGILTIVDGVQAANTIPVDVRALNCDVYAVARHKFCCGPDGAGAMYVRPSALAHFSPTICGVFSHEEHGNGGYRPLKSPQMFEVSTCAFQVNAGACAALKWLRTQVGYQYIYARTERLREQLWQQLNEDDRIELLSAREGYTGLILLRHRDYSCEELKKYLDKEKVYCRVVEHRQPPYYDDSFKGVRIAVSYWNRESDIDGIAGVFNQLKTI